MKFEHIKRSKCKGCQTDIIWGTTSEGKKIPLDPRLQSILSRKKMGK